MQIDFYILGSNSPRNLNKMACQLCEKALAHRLKVLIFTDSIEQAYQLDELLWTYKAESFIVHKNNVSDEPESNTSIDYPVIISSEFPPSLSKNATADPYNAHLLINLSSTILNSTLSSNKLDSLQQFSRVAELVGKNELEKANARDRYRFYREKGYTLNKYDL